MSVILKKGERLSLEKTGGQKLSKIFMGLGWDPVKNEGILGKLFNRGKNIDLDASCVIYDANKAPLDAIYFGRLQSADGSIIHTGDNLTGDGDGDDEVIKVNLDRLPPNVRYLVFTVCSFRGQTFEEVENAFCRLVNDATGQELAKFTISGGGRFTAMIMAKLYRHNGVWKIHAIGEYANAKTVAELVVPIASML